MDAAEGWTSVQVANTTSLLQHIQALYSAAGNLTAWTSPFFFTEFVSVDTSGNEAVQAVRTVFSADCGVGGRLCPDLSCDTFGICGLASQTPTTSQYNIQLGPQISLKGNGQILGGNIMQHVIDYGNELFVIPPVVAFDDLDGDLTALVSAFGLKSFSVMFATVPGMPHVISYSVTDSDGNTAKAGRTISIICKSDEILCTANDGPWLPEYPSNELLHCSRDSFCGPATHPVPALPQVSISLVGEALLILPVNAVYAKCPYPRPLDSVCDLGATAYDPIEGDLSRLIKVCSPPASSSMDTIDASSFDQFGVRYCAIDTQSPGVKNVTFWVADSVGNVATTSRMIMVVQPMSPLLEAVSTSRLSIYDLESSIFDPSGQLHLSEDDQALFQTLKMLLSEKSVPSMRLKPVRSFSSQSSGLETVQLPQGTSLAKCAEDMVLTPVDGFCDPGVNVTTSTGMDLSARVVACPSSECFKTGCPGKRFQAVRCPLAQQVKTCDHFCSH